MATLIQNTSGSAASDLGQWTEPSSASHLQSVSASDSPSLFINPQHEPLVMFPAPAAALPLALPAAASQRAFDVALAFVLLLSLWPVMLAAALCVRLSGPGPIIFRHVRVGRGGTRFACLKFRTMNQQAEKLLTELLGTCGTMSAEWRCNQKIRRDPRVTAVGLILRRFSIDELPQLFNVLRGDMSIVGPRPIVDAEIERYADKFADYCLVNPGLTGLWQVSGRNRLSYDRRVELDCHYARTKSVRGDAWIVVRTVPTVLQGGGY